MDGFAEPVEPVAKVETEEERVQASTSRAYISAEIGAGEYEGHVSILEVYMDGTRDKDGQYISGSYNPSCPAHQAVKSASVLIANALEMANGRVPNRTHMADMRPMVEQALKLGIVSPKEAEKFAIEEGTAPQVGHA